MDLAALDVITGLTAVGVAVSVSAGVTKVVVTKNKIRLIREALSGVAGPDRPAVLRALGDIL